MEYPHDGLLLPCNRLGGGSVSESCLSVLNLCLSVTPLVSECLQRLHCVHPFKPLLVSYQGSSGTLYQIEQEQETSSFIADMSCDGILILELPEEGSDSDEGTPP